MWVDAAIPTTDFGGHALRVRYRLAICWYRLYSDAAQLCMAAFEAWVLVRRGSWGGNGIGDVGVDVRRSVCVLGDMG